MTAKAHPEQYNLIFNRAKAIRQEETFEFYFYSFRQEIVRICKSSIKWGLQKQPITKLKETRQQQSIF